MTKHKISIAIAALVIVIAVFYKFAFPNPNVTYLPADALTRNVSRSDASGTPQALQAGKDISSEDTKTVVEKAKKKEIKIADKTLTVEVADTPALQTLGLSGHAPISDEEGMIFIFASDSIPHFWMKEMLFPLDMIWIDNKGIIADIDKNVPKPSLDTQNTTLPTYSSTQPIRYVLEVNTGFSDKYGVKLGDSVDLSQL